MASQQARQEKRPCAQTKLGNGSIIDSWKSSFVALSCGYKIIYITGEISSRVHSCTKTTCMHEYKIRWHRISKPPVHSFVDSSRRIEAQRWRNPSLKKASRDFTGDMHPTDR